MTQTRPPARINGVVSGYVVDPGRMMHSIHPIAPINHVNVPHDQFRWTVLESSYGGHGEGFVRITPTGTGGSRVHAEWTSTNPRRQRLLLTLMHRGPMNRLIKRLWAATLHRYAQNH